MGAVEVEHNEVRRRRDGTRVELLERSALDEVDARRACDGLDLRRKKQVIYSREHGADSIRHAGNCTRSVSADGELERAQNFRQKQRAFLERHLGAWVPDFSGSVEEQAQTEFYRSLAAATRLFIESDFSRCHGEAPVLLSGSPAAGHIFHDQRGTRA